MKNYFKIKNTILSLIALACLQTGFASTNSSVEDTVITGEVKAAYLLHPEMSVWNITVKDKSLI